MLSRFQIVQAPRNPDKPLFRKVNRRPVSTIAHCWCRLTGGHHLPHLLHDGICRRSCRAASPELFAKLELGSHPVLHDPHIGKHHRRREDRISVLVELGVLGLVVPRLFCNVSFTASMMTATFGRATHSNVPSCGGETYAKKDTENWRPSV